MCFTLELEHFVCNHATTIENEKVQSKGIAMHAYSVSEYHACTRSQLGQKKKVRSKGIAMHVHSVSEYYVCTGSQLIQLGQSCSK